jgi:hypothetical protein
MRPDVGIKKAVLFITRRANPPAADLPAGVLLARNYADAERLRRPGSMAAATIRSFSLATNFGVAAPM